MVRKTVVFMGTPAFGAAMLEQLLNEDCIRVTGVVSQPDRPVGRKQVMTPSAVKQLALQHDIPVFQPEKIRQDYQAVLAWRPDLIVTCAYGQIVPQEILDGPPLGCVNVHASLLPKLRGGAPIQRAVMEGYEMTGVTIMEMAAGMDSGAIISQRRTAISQEDTYGTLHDKLIVTAAGLLHDTLPALLEHSYTPIPQDPSQVTYGYNIKKEEEHLDLTLSYQAAYDHIRGLIPAPCSYIIAGGKKLKLCAVQKTGQTFAAANGTLVKAGRDLGLVMDGRILRITQVQPEGKGVMPAAAFLNGAGRALEGTTAR